MGGQLIEVLHKQFAADLNEYYEAAAVGQNKDILGFEKPLPPLPPHVPHDDSLFFVFFGALMSLVVIPSALSLLFDVYRALRSTEVSSLTVKRRVSKRSLVVRALVVGVGVVMILWSVHHYFDLQDIQYETLYQTLGLDFVSAASITPQDIKSAWKTLALKYHPDKQHDSDDESFNSDFVAITKAYHILMRKHGGYDDAFAGEFEGPLLLALPSWISDPHNSTWVILGYFTLLSLILFYLWKRTTLTTSDGGDTLISDLLSYEMNRAPRNDVNYFEFSDEDHEE